MAWRALRLPTLANVAALSVGALFVTAWSLGAMAPSQAYAPSVREIAPVDMRSRCAADAAADVDRGAAFLLALAPVDARRAFERAADRDPDCALAGWGRAMSWLPADPLRLPDLARREGGAALRRVSGRGTAREQAYVAAAAFIFDRPADVPEAVRLRDHRDAMRKLAAAFPDDPVATILLARATLMLSTLPDDQFQNEAATIVERRFGAAPDQLGAGLTLLLTRDRLHAARMALPAAEAVARLATLPLPRHLPARTFARLGDWSAAVESTEAAIALAGSPGAAELVYGVERRDVAAEWLVDAYLQQGRVARARVLIEEVRRAVEAGVGVEDGPARAALSAAIARMETRYILARGAWTRGRTSEARTLGCDDPPPSPACPFIQAYSAARLAWPGANADLLADATRLLDPLGGAGAAGPASVAELLRVLVRAAIAAGQEEHQELELLASHAIELEERLQRSGQLVLPLAPTQELCGDLFLQARRFQQAQRHYRDALALWPNRAHALLGVARASAGLDDRQGATDAYQRFLELWRQADRGLPELEEARKWLDTVPAR
jgi:tetratricopeptide (TPR) repeat protein